MRLIINREEIIKLRRLVRSIGSKEEATGVFLGKFRGDDYFVGEVKVLRNRLHSPVRFEVDPEELYRVLVEAEEKGLEVVGMWHTHPGTPAPSSIDLYYMKLWPVVWLIMSSIDGSYKAYILKEEKLVEVEVVEI